MVSMGRRRLPCDLHFSLRFDGEPVSISKLTFLSGSRDRVVTVARRGLDGVDVVRIPATPSEGKAGRFLSTLGTATWLRADIDEAF